MIPRYEMPLLTDWQPSAGGRWVLVEDVQQALVPLLAILEVTRGNLRSLGPAGALGPVYAPYTVWLHGVEAALAHAQGLLPDEDAETPR